MTIRDANNDTYTFNQYSESVKNMIPYDNFDSPDDIISHGFSGLVSEVGEVGSILQHVYQGKPIDDEAMEHIKKELGDCLWFLNELAIGYGFTLSDIARTNYEKLYNRFGGEKYNEERDLNRKAGDI